MNDFSRKTLKALAAQHKGSKGIVNMNRYLMFCERHPILGLFVSYFSAFGVLFSLLWLYTRLST